MSFLKILFISGNKTKITYSSFLLLQFKCRHQRRTEDEEYVSKKWSNHNLDMRQKHRRRIVNPVAYKVDLPKKELTIYHKPNTNSQKRTSEKCFFKKEIKLKVPHHRIWLYI